MNILRLLSAFCILHFSFCICSAATLPTTQPVFAHVPQNDLLKWIAEYNQRTVTGLGVATLPATQPVFAHVPPPELLMWIAEYTQDIASLGGTVSLDYKANVAASTTANITIATALNVGDVSDGVTLAAGTRVLVRFQTDAAENGIYVAGVTPARATDSDTWPEMPGSMVLVTGGTINANSIWVNTSAATGTIGVTAVTYVSLGGNRVWTPEQYGAIANDSTDDRAAIQSAIDACEAAGGGVVQFGAGTYVIAPAALGYGIWHDGDLSVLQGMGETTILSCKTSTSTVAHCLIAPRNYNNLNQAGTSEVPYGGNPLYIRKMRLTSDCYSTSSLIDPTTWDADAGNGHDLIGIGHCPWAIIEEVGFEQIGGHIFEINVSKNVRISDCYLYGTGNVAGSMMQLDPMGSMGLIDQAGGTLSQSTPIENILIERFTQRVPRTNLLIGSAVGGSTSVFTATFKALTSNVATITTSAPHGYQVGLLVTVALSAADPVFDGTYTIASVPTTTTFTYARTNDNVGSTATAGSTTAPGAASLASGVQLSHTTSNTTVLKDVVFKDCRFIPHANTVITGTGTYFDVVMAWDSAAYPAAVDGLTIDGCSFIGGGLTGSTKLIDLGSTGSASSLIRNVRITNNVADTACQRFIQVGSPSGNTGATALTTVSATNIASWNNVLIENNVLRVLYDGNGTAGARTTRSFVVSSCRNAVVRGNSISIPNRAVGSGWGTSTVGGGNWGFYFQNCQYLTCDSNSVEVAITTPVANYSGFIFSCGAMELASQGPIPGHWIVRNNYAFGNGSVGYGLVAGFEEMLTTSTERRDWANPAQPVVTGEWSGNLATSGGTIYDNLYVDWPVPVADITTTQTLAAAAVLGGHSNWGNGEDTVQLFSNAAVTVNPKTTVLVQTGTMSASRVVTLPYASMGRNLRIVDASGTVTSTNTLVLTRAGSDTVDGGTTSTLSVAYATVDLFPNGNTAWNTNRKGDFTTVSASGPIASAATTPATLAAAATTLAITSNGAIVTGDAGGNTLATITGGSSGQILVLKFTDALVTITDTDAATANTVDLSAAFTSTARDTITLWYDGTKWIEMGRSAN